MAVCHVNLRGTLIVCLLLNLGVEILGIPSTSNLFDIKYLKTKCSKRDPRSEKSLQPMNLVPVSHSRLRVDFECSFMRIISSRSQITPKAQSFNSAEIKSGKNAATQSGTIHSFETKLKGNDMFKNSIKLKLKF
ncbi:hypothetical protein CROQUDRAFT_96707 [Cronartium quercuum f. sp. fusiforme G11]|uniref:Uncharacterized protein n=1 Tax=Cronartium quercuum f. sp. fusiforme G11 TaxID=708437 RepID=A0A9P6T908_9BASI|nr:hypothetical protein CROQUDRAFT_96707 [Cronartium quercuum f. sp. fusiforme G11]